MWPRGFPLSLLKNNPNYLFQLHVDKIKIKLDKYINNYDYISLVYSINNLIQKIYIIII
jgi:hypothetical protein